MIDSNSHQTRPRRLVAARQQQLLTRVLLGIALVLTVSAEALAQTAEQPASQSGRVIGTVTDVKGAPLFGATVVVAGPDASDRRSVSTDENGSFEINGLKPGVSYQVVVSGDGFEAWTSPAIILAPGEFKLMGEIPLDVTTQQTVVHVTYSPVELATQQLKQEEQQRVLGILPNFYVSYEGENTARLTAKMKFQLALKVSYDPATIGGIAMVSASRQAVNTPKYGQGWGPYGERFGATAADGFTDIMIGGAILPSLLHEDPRYFYQGTGTTKSRLRHALLSPFIGRRDNGTWGPNYSSVGGDLGSAALSNLYFPQSQRGPGLVMSLFALGTAERLGSILTQEFVIGRMGARGSHMTNDLGQ
jgi:hypothetical protein